MKVSAIILLFQLCGTVVFSYNSVKYTEPLNGSKFVNINNNIIIGFEREIFLTEKELLNCIIINGSKSGTRFGRAVTCADKKRILFKTDKPFDYDETVTVKISGKLAEVISSGKKHYEYQFRAESEKTQKKFVNKPSKPNGESLIFEPLLNVNINNNPSPGYLFTAPYAGLTYLSISNNNGSTYWYTTIPFGGDFKKQPNGNLTYFNGARLKHYEMDASYNIIDSFACGNGYTTDIHELLLLANRHAMLMAYDTQIVDMSQIVEGGNPAACVIGLVIQEIDANKNVVFQWRSWDHFEITDATHENLLDSVIDYVHGNAIEIDFDGNIMISSRHLDEITKINRTTGEIIWRLGGRNNQFTFINDSLRFSYQHDIRRIPNGNITLHDNGNYHTPPFSRAVEYALDESNKTATLVWQFRRTPSIFGFWGGNVQRLPGGNTLIAWGGASRTLTEVRPNGTIALEASFSTGIYTYRAYKFEWGTPVILNNEGNTQPLNYRLYANYPNPFNPYTTISFDLPTYSMTELLVFDIAGRVVRRMLSEELQGGRHTYKFDGTNLASGIYFYKLRAGSFTSTQKMILTK